MVIVCYFSNWIESDLNQQIKLRFASMSEVLPKRPTIKYRVELEKRLEINKSYKERRNRAVAIRILSYGLFGQKRFQNLYLSCSLNCFYWALQIANFLHQRVAGLAMIIKFEQVHVIEYYESELENGKTYAEQKYTKIVIKLTKTPTEEDKKEPGFNAGFDSAKIKDELKEIIGANRRDAQRGERPSRPRRNRRVGGERRERNTERERGDRNDRPQRAPRRDREERKDREQRRERPERRDREDRRDRRQQSRREDRPERRENDRRQRRERDEYREDRYGDDRDERRIYKNEGQERSERQYERGETMRRGAPRYKESQRREQRPRYEAKQSQAPARQNRGDRNPRRNRRYSDDED